MSPRDYPAARRDEIADVLHGVSVADPYRWLEDAADPEVEAWSTAQDAIYAAESLTWPGQARIRARLNELVDAGAVSVPVWRGERQFFVRRDPGAEHPRLITKVGDGPERVLLDPAVIDPTGLTTLDGWQPSKEGDLLAYQLSEGGDEESVLRVMDIESGAIIDGPIDRARYSPVAFVPGGKEYYFVRRLAADLVPEGETQYHRRVWLHRVGNDPAEDVCIFGEDQPMTSYFGVSVSRDGRWLTISASEGTAPRNDVWLADLFASSLEAPELVTVQEGVDAQTGIEVGRDGRLYVFTDLDAPLGRVCVADPHAPTAEHWVDLIPQSEDAVMEGYSILDQTPELPDPLMLVVWSRHAVSEMSVHSLSDGRQRDSVALPGLGTLSGLSERPEGGYEAWFGYTDHTTPSLVSRLDARDGSITTWATAPGQVDVPDVRTEHITYTSKDGTAVRMFVMSPGPESDKASSGSGESTATSPRPTILYGYGGFGISLTPAFSAAILAWVEAGGTYVVTNLRGGGEEGEEWHRDGMLAKKQNSFDDFYSAAEWLIEAGRATPEQIVAMGGSNGGLLVGAAVTQRPDLFGGIVCSAPLLDMVRSELFGLGASWTVEYGSAAVAEQFGWLHEYSPYHHVRAGTKYPATLFTVFDSDSRVDPLHARKLCAALQAATHGDGPILLRREQDVGHGARSVSRSLDLSTETMAFAAHVSGLALD
jgi:prolyl oligopeptidase